MQFINPRAVVWYSILASLGCYITTALGVPAVSIHCTVHVYRCDFWSNNGIPMLKKTKPFISADSPSWAEQNGTNDFVVACTVVEIFLCEICPWKAGFLWFLQCITLQPNMIQQKQSHYFTQCQLHILMISISYNYEKIPKNWLWLAILSRFAIFTIFSKH